MDVKLGQLILDVTNLRKDQNLIKAQYCHDPGTPKKEMRLDEIPLVHTAGSVPIATLDSSSYFIKILNFNASKLIVMCEYSDSDKKDYAIRFFYSQKEPVNEDDVVSDSIDVFVFNPSRLTRPASCQAARITANSFFSWFIFVRLIRQQLS